MANFGEYSSIDNLSSPATTDRILSRTNVSADPLEYLSRLQIHTLLTGESIIFGDGDTKIGESADDVLDFTIANSLAAQLNSSRFRVQHITRAVLDLFSSLNTPAADTEISRINFRGEDDSSNEVSYARIGGYVTDDTNLSEEGYLKAQVIVGGIITEVLRVDGSTTALDTRLMIYDVDNGQMERVTVGALNSGGTGKKLLCIPN